MSIESVIHTLARHIENHAAEPLTLATLAKKSGYSAAHLQREFTRVIGSSPRQYQQAARQGKLRNALKTEPTATAAIIESGYGSPSRVYESLPQTLGMTPKQYKSGGQGLTIFYASSKTKFGWLLMAATSNGLCRVRFGEDEESLHHSLYNEFPQAALKPMNPKQQPILKEWMEALQSYLKGEATALEKLPLDIQGTAFQLKVWRYLQQEVPAGTVQSYKQVAEAIGHPKAMRAVGSACANNKLALVIPCHRVIRGDGDINNYRWGKNRKESLLQMEQSRPNSKPANGSQNRLRGTTTP